MDHMYLPNDPMIASALVRARRDELSAATQASSGRPLTPFQRGWMPHPVAHILHGLGHLLTATGRRLEAYALDPWCHQQDPDWAYEGSSL